MTPAENVAMRALHLSAGDTVSERRWREAVQIAEIVLEAFQDDAPAAQAPAPTTGPRPQSPRAISRLKGYTGDTCPDCGNLSMVRNGTCLKCDDCGATTGCS